MKAFILLLGLLLVAYAHDHPMVAMISHPLSPTNALSDKYNSYIQGESVKFVESSGVRNVAIKYDQDLTSYNDLLSQLNGIFVQNSFEVDHSKDFQFLDTLQKAYDYTLQQNDKGDLFPMWISGVSANDLVELLTGSQDVVVKIDALDYSTALSLSESFNGDERMYITHNIKHHFLKHASDANAVYFNQDYGVTVESYKSNDFLSSHFEIVAKAKDRAGTDFVAMLKSKRYPVIMSFILFESVYNFYPDTNVPHTSESTRLTVQFSKAFTNMCRLNDRKFPETADEYKNNIFNNPLTTVTGPEYQTFYF